MIQDNSKDTNQNFENPVNQTPNDFMKMIVLQKKQYVSQCLFLFNQQLNKGNTPNIYQVKTAITDLFDEIKFSMFEDISNEEYYFIAKLLMSDKDYDIIEANNKINGWLHKIELTTIFKKVII